MCVCVPDQSYGQGLYMSVVVHIIIILYLSKVVIFLLAESC